MQYGVYNHTKQRQSHFMKVAVAAGMAVTLAAGMMANAFAATNVVTPSNTMGWVDGSANGGTTTYVNGDAPAGFGTGSLQLETNETNPSRANYSHEVNQPLSEVTELSYYTKQLEASSPAGTASMFVSLDLDNDGDFDTSLIYEPYWQNAGSPDPAPVVADEWQEWDVDSGLFWSSRNYSGALNLVAGAGGPPFYTLDQILTAYPDAQVMTFGANVGTFNPSYTILVDGIAINDTVYDFETFAVVTSKDQCKQDGWMDFAREDGSAFGNQGQCVSYVQSSMNSRHHR